MKKFLRNIKTVLIPIGAGADGETALAIAQAIAEGSFPAALFRLEKMHPSALAHRKPGKSANACFL